jgi:ABC-2 type transport system ATP-binding protein
VSVPIAIRDLTKCYGSVDAVSHLTLDIAEGSVCGLLGPNGAGKTTTFKCLLGFARPNSGTVAIDGAPLTAAVFERLSYVPEKSALYEWMTVAEHLEMNRRSYRTFDAARARELIDIFELDLKKRVKTISKGQHTALALVLAFSIRPRLLVLDEPASGLDPVRQRAVLDLIIDAAAGGATVLFSSHQITQVERAADRIAILKEGKLVLDGDVDTLKGNEKIVEAFFESELPSLNGLSNDARVRRIERSGRMLRAYVSRESEAVARDVAALGAKRVDVVNLNLEDIFLGAVAPERVSPTGEK